MIDRSLINPKALLDAMLDDVHGNVNMWMRLVEIVPNYMPPFPRAGDEPSIQVRCLVRPSDPEPAHGVTTQRYSYLRHSGIAGWQNGGYFWDMYGTRWPSVEHAFLAVLHAPVPPGLLVPHCWSVAS